jgi:hypothetical protein
VSDPSSTGTRVQSALAYAPVFPAASTARARKQYSYPLATPFSAARGDSVFRCPMPTVPISPAPPDT